MKIIRDIADITEDLRGAVVTIGNFDGVHLGHQAIFREVIGEARRRNKKSAVITFDPHPKMILHPEIRPFLLITTIEEKAKLIEEAGIDALIIIPFSKEFSGTTAGEFVSGILWDKLRITRIIIGHDYRFGRGKEGNEKFLLEHGRRLGFEVDVVSAFRKDDTVISSTRVRQAILEGKVDRAARMLGRPYNLVGSVIHGHSRGAGLGFPTANISPEKVLIPPDGVYAVVFVMDGKRYQGVLNIGNNPTFGDESRSIEVFILDFHETIYDKTVELLFIERIRGEVKFDGPDKLIAQIRKDVDTAKFILKSHI